MGDGKFKNRLIKIPIEDSLTLPINIKGKDEKELQDTEEIYRKAGQELNKTIIQYRSKYSKEIDASFIYSMAALKFALENITLREIRDLDELMEKIKKLNDDLELYLQE